MRLSVSSIKKWIHSHHFKTSLAMLLFLSHCFLLIIFVLWQNQYQTAVREKAEFHLRQLLNYAEETMTTGRDSALFAGTLPSVQNALLSPAPSLDQLIALDRDLSPFVTMTTYDSFVLSLDQSGLIYDSKSSLYQRPYFYNPGLLERFARRRDEEYWEFGYPYQRYYDSGSPSLVLTYLHSLPLYGLEKYGFIAVNIPLTELTRYFNQTAAGLSEKITLSFENKPLWSNAGSDAAASGSARYQERLPVTLTSASYPALRGEVYLPRHFVWLRLFSYLPLLIPCYLCLILLNFSGALAYSFYHLNRFDLFLAKIGMDDTRILTGENSGRAASIFSAASPKPAAAAADYDEFQLLQQAADHFQTEIHNIRQSAAANKPLLQERLLTDILYHHVEVTAIPPEYETYDISFPHPYFCVILIAVQEIESVANATIKEELKLIVKQNAAELFASLGKVYSLYSEKENLLFLLNTSETIELRDKIYSIALALKKGMKDSLGFHLLFSVAFCDAKEPIPYYAWTKARKNLIFASGGTDSFILFSDQEDSAAALMPSVIPQITQAIIDKNGQVLTQIIKRFYAQSFPAGTPVTTTRKTILLATAAIFSALLEMDIFFPIEDMNQMLRQVEQTGEVERIEELFRAYLTGLIETENKISRDAHEYIEKTIAYLETHFAEALTIPQIAENVGISPIYLNKIFKLATGKTLSEYLNFYRTEKSKDMLKNSNLTVNDISKALGYNDVRSYIRFFKKFYDITPNHYRKTQAESR